jgi:hypothetical protein
MTTYTFDPGHRSQPETPWSRAIAKRDQETSDDLNRRLGLGVYRNEALRNGGRCVECDSSGRHKSHCSRHSLVEKGGWRGDR